MSIKTAVKAINKELDEAFDEYNKKRSELLGELADLRKLCKHSDSVFVPDPSGNNDSYYRCSICGGEF